MKSAGVPLFKKFQVDRDELWIKLICVTLGQWHTNKRYAFYLLEVFMQCATGQSTCAIHGFCKFSQGQIPPIHLATVTTLLVIT